MSKANKIRGRSTTRDKKRDRNQIRTGNRKKERSDAYDKIDLGNSVRLPRGAHCGPEYHDDQAFNDYDSVLEEDSNSSTGQYAVLESEKEEELPPMLIDDAILNAEVHFEIKFDLTNNVVVDSLHNTSSASKGAALLEMRLFLEQVLRDLNEDCTQLSTIELLLHLHELATSQRTTSISDPSGTIPTFKLSDRTKSLYSRKLARLPDGRVFSLGLLISNEKAKSFKDFPEAILILALNHVFKQEVKQKYVFDDTVFCGKLRLALRHLLGKDLLIKNPYTSEIENLQRRLNGRAEKGKSPPRDIFPLKSSRREYIERSRSQKDVEADS